MTDHENPLILPFFNTFFQGQNIFVFALVAWSVSANSICSGFESRQEIFLKYFFFNFEINLQTEKWLFTKETKTFVLFFPVENCRKYF
jgi:hypothetical protein